MRSCKVLMGRCHAEMLEGSERTAILFYEEGEFSYVKDYKSYDEALKFYRDCGYTVEEISAEEY